MTRLLLAAMLLAASCQTPTGSAGSSTPNPTAPEKPHAVSGEPIHLTIVGTNDIHGWVYPHTTQVGSESVDEGGVATFSAYLKVIRDENPGGVLLLDAGDLFQGTLASNLTEGSVVVDAYNQLGYMASAIGNHEFDYGPEGPVSVASEPGQDPFGALKARLKQAKFPLLATNIYESRTGDRPAWLGNDGTLLVDVKGVRVGIFGLVTPQTPTTTNPVNVATLRFGSLVPEAERAAKSLRERGAKVVIAIAHAGGKCQKWNDPNDTSSCDLVTGEIFEMLQGLPAGTIDAVVAGHTHAVIGQYVKGTPVIETWGLGRYFGLIDLYLDPETDKPIAAKTKISPVIPICPLTDEKNSCNPNELDRNPRLHQASFHGVKIAKDVAMERLIAPALARVEAEQRRELGVKTASKIGRNYEGESALGSLLADNLREIEGADVVLLNPGGLRSDLPEGSLTYGAVYEVLPFDNTIATISITGDELKRLLQAAYGARKGVFQVSGLKIKLSQCLGHDRLKAFTLADGKPILPEKRYKLVTSDFLARGGDGLGPVLTTLPPGRIDFGLARDKNLRDSFVGYWQKKKQDLVPPAPGRIAFVDDGNSCPKPAAQTGIP